MKEFLSVQSDVESVKQALSGIKKKFPQIQRQALIVIARGANKQIKATLKSSLIDKSRKDLLKAQVYKAKKDGSEVNLYPKALGKRNWAAGLTQIMNYGSDRVGRGRNGIIKPKSFIQSGEQYIESGAYNKDVEILVQKELDKYFG